MISQQALQSLDAHSSKFPMLQDQIDKITGHYKEK